MENYHHNQDIITIDLIFKSINYFSHLTILSNADSPHYTTQTHQIIKTHH